jgi:supervillin
MLIRKDDKVHVWHGCKSRSHTVYGAEIAAEKLVNRMGTSENVSEYQEGAESKAFWDLFPGGKDLDYFSLRDDERIYSKSLRLFRLYEDKQAFVYKETDYLLRVKDLLAPYPLIQEELYQGADQPALFILDAHFTVYVWVGWWPTHSPDGTPLTHTGSAKTDHVEKYKLALQTTVSYVEACDYKETPVMLIVNAGSEPEEFRALFPWWNHQAVGSKPSLTGRPGIPLNEELQKFLQTEFTLAELQEKPIGCDPLKLEEYLSTKEFEAIFNMPKKSFAQLPRWKQSQLKKPHRLF